MVYQCEPFGPVHGPDRLRKKIPLYRQLPDLFKQWSHQGLVRSGLAIHSSRASRKKRRRSFKQGFLPCMNLAGMNPKPARQLGHRAFFSDRRQRDLRLELRTVFLPSIPSFMSHLRPTGRSKGRLSLSYLSSFRVHLKVTWFKMLKAGY